jgi:hypothetical protein
VMEAALLETAEAWEQDGGAAWEGREILGAVDTTVLQRLLLVCLALVSGDRVWEAVAEERTSATWEALGATRVETLGPDGLSLGRDRAQALLKLAATGRGCLSMPDWLHLTHEVVQSASWAMLGRRRHARQALRPAPERLRRSHASAPCGVEAQQALAALGGQCGTGAVRGNGGAHRSAAPGTGGADRAAVASGRRGTPDVPRR